jgi:hypothetical protein
MKPTEEKNNTFYDPTNLLNYTADSTAFYEDKKVKTPKRGYRKPKTGKHARQKRRH